MKKVTLIALTVAAVFLTAVPAQAVDIVTEHCQAGSDPNCVDPNPDLTGAEESQIYQAVGEVCERLTSTTGLKANVCIFTYSWFGGIQSKMDVRVQFCQMGPICNIDKANIEIVELHEREALSSAGGVGSDCGTGPGDTFALRLFDFPGVFFVNEAPEERTSSDYGFGTTCPHAAFGYAEFKVRWTTGSWSPTITIESDKECHRSSFACA